MPAKTQNELQHVLNKTHPIPVSTQNVSQLVLTKHSLASTDGKSNETCVDQIPPMLATTNIISQLVLIKPLRTHNVSQLVLTKPIPCQGRHKMYLNK